MNEHQPFPKPSETSQVAQIISKFLPYWPLFVISVGLSLAVTYIKLRAEQPIYTAYGKVLLKDPNKGSDSKVLEQLDLGTEKKAVENEILVLRSANLMKEVVKRLGLNVVVFNEGRVRIEELYKETAPVWFMPVQPDSIFDGGKYYFSVDWKKKQIGIDNKVVPFNGEFSIANTLYKVIPNPIYNQNVVGKNYYAEFYSTQNASANLIGALSANPVSPTSTAIDVRINTAVPAKGINVLDALFVYYIERSVLDKKLAAENTIFFIDERIGKVEEQLDSVEQGEVNYMSQQTITDLPTQGQTYFQQTTELGMQRSEVTLQLNMLNNIRSSLRNNQDGASISVGSIADPSLAAMVQKVNESKANFEKISAVSGEKSSSYINAKEQYEASRKELGENVDNVQKQLSTARNSYSGQIGQNISKLKVNPKLQKAYNAIKRQANVKSSIYTFLLTKKEETALNSAGTIPDVTILESANAYGPVSPVPKSFYTTGLLIGLLIPTLFVLLKEQLNRKVQMRSEIESKTAAPIVAEIAQVNSDSPIVIRDGKRTAVAEQFRSLRTNLTFMGLTEKTNTILLTSSVSGEGKSFTAINLAVSFTLIGKKVALLELDLRKPKVSKLLNLPNDIGISNYLVDQATITDIIKPTEIKDLFVLPSGIIPPNPAELLLKDRFRKMMAEVKDRFDYVIIDTAPVGPVSDAFLLKEYADATVYMVRQNKTQRSYLKLINDLNENKKFNNLCLVFNGVKKKAFTYGSAGYGTYGEGYYVQDEPAGKINLIGKKLKKTFGMS